MGGSCSCLNNRSSSNSLYIGPKSLEGQTSLQTLEEKIEQSKTHWSQVAKFELDVDEVVEVSNKEVFQTWQSHPNWGSFFQTFGKDGIGELVMGQKFAEGGQAELYDVEIHWKKSWRNMYVLNPGIKWALKVFKKGTSIQQLQQQWPRGMLQNYVDIKEGASRGNPPKLRNYSDVCYAILLEDGRFAFLMVKEHGDLRHHIDHLMLTTKKNHCPFMNIQNVEKIMYRVATGMEQLHERGIIHRDLKASNVLYTKFESGWTYCVADFECSIGVIGTGFFRAPEILQACKDYSINDKLELFTKESDVYSYGMLCYEILIGKLPFEDYKLNDFDHVLLGERPKLPKYVPKWIRELLRMCWQSNPIDRPSFGEILKILVDNSTYCSKLHTFRKKIEAKIAMGIEHSALIELPID